METSSNASCQTCLGQLDHPIDLFESTYSELLDVLQRLLTFQVFIEGNEFKVCFNCQQRLIAVYEFKSICLKSLKNPRDGEHIRIGALDDDCFSDDDSAKKQRNEDMPRNDVSVEISKRDEDFNDDLQQTKRCDENLEGASIDPNDCKWQCDVCKKKFKLITSLRRHLTQAHNENTFEENETVDIATNDEKPPEILEDEKPLLDTDNTNLHDAESDSGRIQESSSKAVETSETDIESNSSSDTCPFCNKHFKDIALHMTQTHAWINSTDKDHYMQKEHLCQLCGKILQSASRLKCHVALHSNKKLFECSTCGKYYPSEHVLQQHVKRLHSGPYVCDFCGKKSSALLCHKRHRAIHIHQDDKPYKCNICSYSTIKSFALTTHMKQHPEDTPQANNPHRCSYCSRSYSTNALLLSHIRLKHSKESIHS